MDFNLDRFRKAQAPVMGSVRDELAAGHKQSHWMWFIFPQFAGLGRSDMARFYGISSLDEARAYLADPDLGARLRNMSELVLTHASKSAHAIFGSPDDMKFHSSMTLFSLVERDRPNVFADALLAFYDGKPDRATVQLAGNDNG